jgi:hypothetical protein
VIKEVQGGTKGLIGCPTRRGNRRGSPRNAGVRAARRPGRFARCADTERDGACEDRETRQRDQDDSGESGHAATA